VKHLTDYDILVSGLSGIIAIWLTSYYIPFLLAMLCGFAFCGLLLLSLRHWRKAREVTRER